MFESVMPLCAQYGPIVLFGLLFLSSFGLPMAKSLVLVTAGILTNKDLDQGLWLFISCCLGLHMGDFALFLLGRYLGKEGLNRGPLSYIVRPKLVDQAEQFVARYGISSILVARVAPFVRGPCYFLLGSLKMSRLKFTALNLAAASVYTTLFFVIGYALDNRGGELRDLARSGNVLIMALFLISCLLIWHRAKTRVLVPAELKIPAV